jgi:hypothetical protein
MVLPLLASRSSRQMEEDAIDDAGGSDGELSLEPQQPMEEDAIDNYRCLPPTKETSNIILILNSC